MDSRVIPPKRVTSPTWGPPPPCKQALGKKNVTWDVNRVGFGRARAAKAFACLLLNSK